MKLWFSSILTNILLMVACGVIVQGINGMKLFYILWALSLCTYMIIGIVKKRKRFIFFHACGLIVAIGLIFIFRNSI